jgi:hypothetical protein
VPEAQTQATGVIPRWRFPAPQYALRTPMPISRFVNTTPLAKGERNAVESDDPRHVRLLPDAWAIVVGHHPVISRRGWHGYFPRDEVGADARTDPGAARGERRLLASAATITTWS